MNIKDIEQFVSKLPKKQPTYVKINFKKREPVYGLFVQDRDYVHLKSKNFWRIVTKMHFNEFAKSTPSVPLKIKYVDIGVDFNSQTLATYMDSTRRNVIIAGSMEEYFGTKLAASLSPLSKKYQSILVGMPTWDNVNFNKAEFKGVDIVYSTPFFYNRLTPLESRLAADFEKNIGSRPTDMFFRGYESMMRFALLLMDTKKDVASELTRKGNIVFTRFDIQPVFKNKQTMTLDYFENKNVYFVRVSNGAKRLM